VTVNNLLDLVGRINGVLEEKPKGERFIPTRYPFTYAYDFVREFYTELGFDEFGRRESFDSRAETSGVVGKYCEAKGLERRQVVIMLANYYLEYYNVRVESDEISDRLDDLGDGPWW